MEVVQLMKALSDETRMRILNMLKCDSLCVCEIEAVLGISQSNASRHLNKLAAVRILEYYKVSNYVYYRINENTIREYPFVKEIIEEHSVKLKQCREDYEKLKLHKDSLVACDELIK